MFTLSSGASRPPGTGRMRSCRSAAGAARTRAAVLFMAALALALSPAPAAARAAPQAAPAERSAPAVQASQPNQPDQLADRNPDRRCSPSAYGLWRIFNWHEEAAWQLSAARPRVMEVSNARPRPGPGALTVSAEVTKCPEGFTPAVTVTLVDADGRSFECPVQLRSSGRRSGSVLVPDFGAEIKRVLVTARLVSSDGDADRGRPADARPARCRISVSFAPAAERAGGISATAVSASTSPAAPRTAATGTQVLSTIGPAIPTDLKPLASPPDMPSPQIEVKRVTRQTSSRDEDRTYHALWLWSFGDGVAYPDLDPQHTVSTQLHPFLVPGVYTVTAKSISNKGTVLRDLSWTVLVPPPLPGAPFVPVVRAFSAETVREPDVRIKIAGPRKWVVGRPADFSVGVDFADPPHANRVSVLIDPGREFTVVWDRPGHFVVRVAAVVHLRYEFPERVVSIVNTYVAEQKVEVFATVSTD